LKEIEIHSLISDLHSAREGLKTLGQSSEAMQIFGNKQQQVIHPTYEGDEDNLTGRQIGEDK
jgi:hypothetical protein